MPPNNNCTKRSHQEEQSSVDAIKKQKKASGSSSRRDEQDDNKKNDKKVFHFYYCLENREGHRKLTMSEKILDEHLHSGWVLERTYANLHEALAWNNESLVVMVAEQHSQKEEEEKEKRKPGASADESDAAIELDATLSSDDHKESSNEKPSAAATQIYQPATTCLASLPAAEDTTPAKEELDRSDSDHHEDVDEGEWPVPSKPLYRLPREPSLLKRNNDGLYRTPNGRKPHGYEWDKTKGAWRLIVAPKGYEWIEDETERAIRKIGDKHEEVAEPSVDGEEEYRPSKPVYKLRSHTRAISLRYDDDDDDDARPYRRVPEEYEWDEIKCSWILVKDP